MSIDKWGPKYDIPRKKKPPINPGDFDVPGLEIPVPIKMDKWQNLSQPPVRQKKRNPAITTTIAFVDFTVPTLPPIYPDKWLSHFDRPRRSKTITRPTEFTISFIEALNPIGGNYFDTGVVRFEITGEHPEAQTYADRGEISLTVSGEHLEDFQLEDHSVINFNIAYPDIGVEAFASGIPGFVHVSVNVDGENESEWVQGVVTVTREDNTAARFKLTLEVNPDTFPPRKPVELINKVIQINFTAADMTGLVADYIPIFTGICKKVSFNEDIQSVHLSGYDYSGIHQTKGEFVSDDVTTVLGGAIGADSAEVLTTGHSPIWGVVWTGNAVVKDGEDYFIDTLNGTITIPISSRILQFPGSFTYNYSDPFASMKDIIQAVATKKGWIIYEDNVTIQDYSNTGEHPVLSLSDESVIDTCRKFLELSGAKIEGNRYPWMRVYSEVENFVSPQSILIVDEDIIFENSLVFNTDFDDLLNEQTVRSVQKVNANLTISGLTTLAKYEGEQGSINPFTIQGGSRVDEIDYLTPSVLIEHRLNKQGINSLSFTSTGEFFLLWGGINDFHEEITGASWNYFVDGEDFVIQLKHVVAVAGGVPPDAPPFFSGLSRVHAFPAITYSLTVNGTTIEYGGGTIEDIKAVTAQRPVVGITETLKGDVYENAYIETATHCEKICTAILMENGNPYTATFEMPLFEGRNANIGDRLEIKRSGNVIFIGMIKTLSYSVDTTSGKNTLSVRAKGVGVGI